MQLLFRTVTNEYVDQVEKIIIHATLDAIQLASVRTLWAPFRVAEESRSAFGFARSSFSVSVVATCFYITMRHVDKAFITACFSTVNFLNCSFYILKRFNSSCIRSLSISTLSAVARKHVAVPPWLKESHCWHQFQAPWHQ